MFGSAKLRDDIRNLERRLRVANEELKEWRKLVQQKNTELRAANYECSFEFDFKKMNAFSIERIVKDGSFKTVIGYIRPNGDIAEWTFYCSHVTHEKLVTQFREYINAKDNLP